jgi:hypothetical protein
VVGAAKVFGRPMPSRQMIPKHEGVLPASAWPFDDRFGEWLPRDASCSMTDPAGTMRL